MNCSISDRKISRFDSPLSLVGSRFSITKNHVKVRAEGEILMEGDKKTNGTWNTHLD
jgi:hypothetical protein